MFSFGAVAVHAGDTVELSITYGSTRAKLITVYYTAQQHGSLTANNDCPDGTPDIATSNVLRASISGTI